MNHQNFERTLRLRDMPWDILLWVSTNPTHLNTVLMVVYGVDDVLYWICTEIHGLAVSKGWLRTRDFSGEHTCVDLMKGWCLKLSGGYRRAPWEVLCNTCVVCSILWLDSCDSTDISAPQVELWKHDFLIPVFWISNEERLPAEFKHIIKRRKRN